MPACCEKGHCREGEMSDASEKRLSEGSHQKPRCTTYQLSDFEQAHLQTSVSAPVEWVSFLRAVFEDYEMMYVKGFPGCLA